MTIRQAKRTTVHDLTHPADTRKNIPTEELRDFVRPEEEAPETVLYPRDPSLDPQLVWKGKDEQDQYDLAVPAVPIYIQEEIRPRALVNDLYRRSNAGKDDLQPDMFADSASSAGTFGDKVDFYRFDVDWRNRLILGDSLQVMVSLAEKEGLKGKVQTIYLDPPYGIKFGSNWQVSTRKRDVKDGRPEDATRQPEQIKAFRDTWELGIHSYLGYLRDRLTVARDLLTESGSVFVQIGDENVHLVRNILDEVFGSDNFVSQILFLKTSGAGSPSVGTEVLASVSDYLVWYARDREQVKYRSLYSKRNIAEDLNYRSVELLDGSRRTLTNEERTDPDALPAGARVFRAGPLTSQSSGETTVFPLEVDGRVYSPGKGGWKTNLLGMRRLRTARRLIGSANTLSYVRYADDFGHASLNAVWTDTRTSGFGDPKVYVVQTLARVVERCLLMTTDPGDLVLDPTCGSGTTAYVAEQWGRRWITVDTSRVALALARTRLMAAKFPYYLLADSQEGIAKERELTGRFPPDHTPANDVRKGFVYRRVPHVTLKSIANNPDIVEGMTRDQIDQAIARHAEVETLYDQPYEDKTKVRVSGPFTVESLSPHRVMPITTPTDEAPDHPSSASERLRDLSPGFQPRATRPGVPGGTSLNDSAHAEYETRVLANLRRAGVQNTVASERLTFDTLDPHPHPWLHAVGTFTDKAGETRRVAVSIGPEHGTVGPDQIKGAAKEAVRGLGFDILVVCGFAFDAHVAEETTRYGNLTVLTAKMSMELLMGADTLKATGAGNLFIVFGEPDIDVRRTADGRVEVELRGVDVYDPTTAEVRSSSTDDIACWFIDTDYDEESFFVRHAYFTGAQEPYDKLKRALRAEIDESAWASLYRTTSRPFDPPRTGKIAVKAINHYGDEVLKAYDVPSSS